MEDMRINQIPIARFGAQLQLGFSVSGTPIENQYFKGRNRSSFVLLTSVTGMKTLTLPLVFVGTDTHEISRNKSNLDSMLVQKIEIALPDGYEYTCIVDSVGELSYVGDRLATCDYSFLGIQHGPWIETTGPDILCESTAPVTDCIFSTTVSTGQEEYNLAGTVFHNVSAGTKLVVDGINKRILVNGAPGAQFCDFLEFPYLIPGKNRVQAPDPVMVSYWPVYI